MYTDQDIANLLNRVQQLEIQAATRQVSGLPNYGLLSKNFFTRAFSVWGLNLFISFLIGIVFSCLGGIITLLLGGSVVNLINQFLQSFTNVGY